MRMGNEGFFIDRAVAARFSRGLRRRTEPALSVQKFTGFSPVMQFDGKFTLWVSADAGDGFPVNPLPRFICVFSHREALIIGVIGGSD